MIAQSIEALDDDPCIEPLSPTDAWPGSAAKIEVLRQRVERGEQLWHHQDAGTHNVGRPSKWGNWFAQSTEPTPRPSAIAVAPPKKLPTRPTCSAPINVSVSKPQPKQEPMSNDSPAIKPSTADEFLKAADLLINKPESIVSAIDLKIDEHRQAIAKLTRMKNTLADLAKK